MATNLQVWLYDDTGTNYVNATPYVYGLNITRGKTRALDHYEPGLTSVVFDNQTRVFDPTNTSSPFYGYVAAKQRVIVTQGGFTVFSGLIDAWEFSFSVDGTSTASLSASDLTSLFTNQVFVNSVTFPSELSGSRVNRVLDADEVQWPSGWGSRVLDAGTQLLDQQTVEAGTNVFDYLRSVEDSEQGQLFIDASDSLKFQDNSRYLSSSGTLPVLADDNSTYISYGSAIPAWKYDSIEVSFATNLLYNSVVVYSYDGVGFAQAEVPDSIASNSKMALEIENVLYGDRERLQSLATYVVGKYSEPEYRFESIRLNMFALTSGQQETIFDELRLNNFVKIRFTPNSTGSVIERLARIIGIDHDAEPGSYYMTFRFESIRYPSLILDDASYGKLDTNTLGL